MRLLFILSSVLASQAAFAQPKIISQAIINTTTNIIAPEEEEQNNQGGGMNFRNFMDGEIKFTTYLKNDKVKTQIKSEVIKAMIFRDNTAKMTTTVFEMMGAKNGFYVSDSEQVAIKDSMNSIRKQKDSSFTERKEPEVEISYTNEIKKIAGYQCKKAYVISTRLPGVKDTATIWYAPDIKFQSFSSTGGFSGFGNMMGGSLGGLDKIDGFVMRYEMNMRRNRRMEVEVTKIDTSKEIADKEFDIPKDVEIKPIKEMGNLFGGRGGFQMQRAN
jgi:GLPGLI family protein